MKEVNAPGLTIAVTGRDQILWQSDYGLANLGAETPVTSKTLFEIGSLGKPFTNLILLQLQEEGSFDVHAPVSKYLPWFQVQSEFSPISAHHIMSQTAAIIQGTDLGPHGLYESWALRNTRAGAPPGEICSYSNVGYKTLGFLAEKLTGKSFQELIAQRVLEPLGMADSQAAITYDTRRKSATGYTCFYDDRPEHLSYGLVPSIWAESGTGDGCQVSTAADMAKYLRMLLNRGDSPGGRVISEESFGLMTQHVIWTGTDHYGYGLAMYPSTRGTLIGHGGATAGFISAILLDMDAGLGVVALTNFAGEPDSALQLTRYVLAAMSAVQHQEDLPPLPPASNPSSISNGADYAGIYHSNNREIQVTVQGDKLLLHYDGQVIPLERRAGDSFFVQHADFALFLLEFKRKDGTVVEAFHGSEWYVSDQYTGAREFDYPEEWDQYPGHYRARSPRFSNFRVVLRKGTLALVYSYGTVEPLVPLSHNLFRIGEDERLPDTLRFDALVEGQALVADYCGCPYFRTFTP